MAWIEIVSLSVGLILALSAMAKAVRPSYFIGRLAEYEFIPPRLAGIAGGVAIGAEGVISVLLLADLMREAALVAASILLAIFSTAAWLESRSSAAGSSANGIDCGCLGGVLPLRLGRATMGVNLGVCAACIAAAVASFVGAGQDSGEVPAVLLWAFAAALAATFWISQFAFSVLARMRAALDEQGLA
jgi:hypothetical protein